MARPFLQGKTAFVTGAASGIGAACARKFYAEGANVVLVDLSESGCMALAAELGMERCLAIGASVTDQGALHQAAQRAVNTFGGIDVVFANAGIACEPPTTTRAIASEKFQAIIDVNLLGVWRTVNACLPYVVARRGYVLLTASIYAFVNGVANAPYAMTKAGVEMFGRALRAELAGTGATAGVLFPGWVSTPISHSALGGHDIASKMIAEAFPVVLRKPIRPEVVAEEVVAGIRKRAPRIIVPRRWAPVSLARGLVSVLTDRMLDGNTKFHALLRQLEGDE
jgi:NAD(P)-dependent dehydrogenase (short-subunit alcohol dehydrogenase family)